MATLPPLQVLYVEDDRVHVLLMTQMLLGQAWVALRIAEDATEALALAATQPPDVLVLDQHLPGLSGHQLLARLRSLPGLARVHAVLCTADDSAADRQAAQAAGFDGYWTKPTQRATVLAALQALQLARA